MSTQVRFNRLIWDLKRTGLSLGWNGIVGLVLLVFAVILGLTVILPAYEKLGRLEAERDDVVERLRIRGPQSARPTIGGQLADFYAFFPPIERVPDILGAIEFAAKRHKLELEKGEYKIEQEPNFSVQRYQVTLPVTGDYAQIRSFVSAVLDDVPNMAVEELILKRKNISDEQLEARVRFSVFLGASN